MNRFNSEYKEQTILSQKQNMSIYFSQDKYIFF